MSDTGISQTNEVERGLAHFLPRQTVTMVDSHGVRSFTMTPLNRLIVVVGGITLLIWMVIATVTLTITSLSEDHMRQRSATLTLAYETRLQDLVAERDMLSGQLAQVTNRALIAQDQLMIQQQDILHLDAEQDELDTRFDIVQAQLAEMIDERDRAALEGQRRTIELASVQSLMTARLGGQEDITATITTMTSALADAVQARDTVQADLETLTEEMVTIELQRELTAQRQDRMLTQLEGMIEMSLVPLSNMFDAAGLDVDSLLANVRLNYSGTGGLSEDLADPDDPRDARLIGLMEGLDRVAMLNIAASKLPLAMPLRTAFRYSSGFGPRGGRQHRGVDMAGAAGSPIYTTGDGVIDFAGVQSGFGNLVIVDHGNGYKTYYGHMSRIRATLGERVARGDRIGDMGSTGRSSGNHLHYEIRIDGVAINPMTYIKAARNVY